MERLRQDISRGAIDDHEKDDKSIRNIYNANQFHEFYKNLHTLDFSLNILLPALKVCTLSCPFPILAIFISHDCLLQDKTHKTGLPPFCWTFGFSTDTL